MLIALYELRSKSGREKDFEKAWSEVTDALSTLLRITGLRSSHSPYQVSVLYPIMKHGKA